MIFSAPSLRFIATYLDDINARLYFSSLLFILSVFFLQNILNTSLLAIYFARQ